ncbi:MAG: allene oxide cyclase barrel-like domain-containing protein [Sporichthyaceae bacterium]
MSRIRAISHRRRLVSSAALAGAATLTLATLTVAGGASAAGDAPTITVEDGLQILEFAAVSAEDSFRFVPYGEHPDAEFPEDTDPSPGDSFTFGQELVQGDVVVGTDHVTCTSAGADQDNVCSVTMDFADGTISAIGVDRGGDDGVPFPLDIVDGTGTYDGASGTLTVDPSASEEPDLFRLAFTAPAFDPLPFVETVDGVSSLDLYADLISETYTPVGGEPGPEPTRKDFAPAIGDTFTFVDDLHQDGLVVGTDAGLCTITDDEGKASCTATFTFPNGTITVDGPAEFTSDDAFSIPITSGTGAFAGIDGTMYGTTAPKEKDDTILRLVYTQPDA